MRLRVLLPSSVLIDIEVSKIVAEAPNGSFCLLPRHVDFVAGLVPGILSYELENGEVKFLGIDEGILVKTGSNVLVSTRNAVKGADLGNLKEEIEKNFLNLDERERRVRTAEARLEANLVRRFLELEHDGA